MCLIQCTSSRQHAADDWGNQKSLESEMKSEWGIRKLWAQREARKTKPEKRGGKRPSRLRVDLLHVVVGSEARRDGPFRIHSVRI